MGRRQRVWVRNGKVGGGPGGSCSQVAFLQTQTERNEDLWVADGKQVAGDRDRVPKGPRCPGQGNLTFSAATGGRALSSDGT